MSFTSIDHSSDVVVRIDSLTAPSAPPPAPYDDKDLLARMGRLEERALAPIEREPAPAPMDFTWLDERLADLALALEKLADQPVSEGPEEPIAAVLPPAAPQAWPLTMMGIQAFCATINTVLFILYFYYAVLKYP